MLYQNLFFRILEQQGNDLSTILLYKCFVRLVKNNSETSAGLVLVCVFFKIDFLYIFLSEEGLDAFSLLLILLLYFVEFSLLFFIANH